MHRFGVVVLCAASVFSGTVRGQGTKIEPVLAPLGTVQTFHLQTRLNPTNRNELDVLPRSTVIRVKMLDGVDSSVDRDGSEFRGEVVESVSAGDKVIVHSESEVQGILVLLRSKNHPDGFRYELLVTRLTDHAKMYDLTASLNPSFVDAGPPPSPVSNAEAPREQRINDAGVPNLPSTLHN
jgi:hypothetical protein